MTISTHDNIRAAIAESATLIVETVPRVDAGASRGFAPCGAGGAHHAAFSRNDFLEQTPGASVVRGRRASRTLRLQRVEIVVRARGARICGTYGLLRGSAARCPLADRARRRHDTGCAPDRHGTTWSRSWRNTSFLRTSWPASRRRCAVCSVCSPSLCRPMSRHDGLCTRSRINARVGCVENGKEYPYDCTTER